MIGPFDFLDEDGVCCEMCGEPEELCHCIPGPLLPPQERDEVLFGVERERLEDEEDDA